MVLGPDIPVYGDLAGFATRRFIGHADSEWSLGPQKTVTEPPLSNLSLNFFHSPLLAQPVLYFLLNSFKLKFG